MAVLVLACFGLLVARLVYLQVWKHDDFFSISEDNRIALLPVQAPRG